ncbi:MAG: DUF952 domain-containing protein [Paracoccaceae bacterium]|nr:DUF952 domain-containing protein [Paracoccaceae bacterium]
MIIYKILKKAEFYELEKNGESDGSPLDKLDGFIHFSTKEQLSETLTKHFYQKSNLILMAIDSDKILQHLKWEKSRNNKLFPHLYSNLKFDDALWFAPVEFVKNRHIIPPGI